MKIKLLFTCISVILMICGCTANISDKTNIKHSDTEVVNFTASPEQPTQSDVVASDYTLSSSNDDTESSETVSVNETYTASIGFVGDVMMMQSQIHNAKKSDGSYDFTDSFEPMRELFQSVDLMCANLETPLAGKDNGGYTAPNPNGYPSFNAPDELAYNLKDLGVDVLTTANNHCLDRGMKGLKRTIDVIEKADLYQTGTFKDAEHKQELLIIDVNGINVGILAFSAGFNSHANNLSPSEEARISRFYDSDFVKSRIEDMRAAGADYIIVVPHCGVELSLKPEKSHIKMFKQFAQWGADAIMASHPHVVQPIEFIEVTRESGENVKIPIVYSLGNFISNMFPAPKNYGLYVRLDIEKTTEGTVTTTLSYVPVYCIIQDTKQGKLHQTLPCYADQDKTTAYEPLSSSEYRACIKCREFVKDICGKEYLNQN